jgi:hypothetical protein
MQPTIKACCQVTKNLRSLRTDRDDLAVVICRVCKCRHFTLQAEPGVIGITQAGASQ